MRHKNLKFRGRPSALPASFFGRHEIAERMTLSEWFHKWRSKKSLSERIGLIHSLPDILHFKGGLEKEFIFLLKTSYRRRVETGGVICSESVYAELSAKARKILGDVFKKKQVNSNRLSGWMGVALNPRVFRRLLWYFSNPSNLSGSDHASEMIRKAAKEFAWQAWRDCWHVNQEDLEERRRLNLEILPAERAYARPILELMLASGQHQEVEDTLVENDEALAIALEVATGSMLSNEFKRTLEEELIFPSRKNIARVCILAKARRVGLKRKESKKKKFDERRAEREKRVGERQERRTRHSRARKDSRK